MVQGGAGGKPPKLPRPTVPATGDQIRLQIQREGQIVRFQVVDVATGVSRYLGQAQLQPQDVASIKLFVTNRNGAEPINVLWRDLTVRADRIYGAGHDREDRARRRRLRRPDVDRKQPSRSGGSAQGSPAAGGETRRREGCGARRERRADGGAPAATARRRRLSAPAAGGAVVAVAVKAAPAGGNVKVVMAPADGGCGTERPTPRIAFCTSTGRASRSGRWPRPARCARRTATRATEAQGESPDG